ncbi:MAG: FxsA family protein [Gordonia sp. (in: high G+C Gram-positive bacteria)]|uniref:FxsA family protein n=1 Tax=Gordonia sp. (in: high G+C Gram-positive bacteria) TaxID=84139 RepID=UPI003BB6242C
MKRWVFLGYLVVEIAAFWVMVHFLGWGWAILITVAAAAVGFAVLGRRAREIFTRSTRPASTLSTAPTRRDNLDTGPLGTVSDSALFAGATALTILPGIVSTVGGLLLLAPPVRNRLRPVVAAKAAQRATLVAERVTLIGTGPRANVYGTNVYGTTVDGSVVDSTVVASTIVDITARNADGSIRLDQDELPPVSDSGRPGAGGH